MATTSVINGGANEQISGCGGMHRVSLNTGSYMHVFGPQQASVALGSQCVVHVSLTHDAPATGGEGADEQINGCGGIHRVSLNTGSYMHVFGPQQASVAFGSQCVVHVSFTHDARTGVCVGAIRTAANARAATRGIANTAECNDADDERGEREREREREGWKQRPLQHTNTELQACTL